MIRTITFQEAECMKGAGLSEATTLDYSQLYSTPEVALFQKYLFRATYNWSEM